jgi:hypothetical protein
MAKTGAPVESEVKVWCAPMLWHVITNSVRVRHPKRDVY